VQDGCILELLEPEALDKQPGHIFFTKPVVAAMKSVHVHGAE
jgi:hypothetical protein